MAHECPDCGQACYCCGDIDDIQFEENDFCIHCIPEESDEGQDYREDWECEPGR